MTDDIVSKDPIPDVHIATPNVKSWTYIGVGPEAFGEQNIPLHNGKPAEENALVRIQTPSGRRIVVRYDGTIEDTGEPE